LHRRPALDLTQTVGAVVALGGDERAPERLGRALGDAPRRGRAPPRQEPEEVDGGVRDVDVAGHGGDPGQTEVGRAPGIEQGQGVVDPGIGVDEGQHGIPMSVRRVVYNNVTLDPRGKEEPWTSTSCNAESETTCPRPPVCRPPSRASTASTPV